MAVFTWKVWKSERALRTASVLLQGTAASSLPPVGSWKKMSGTDSQCEGMWLPQSEMSQGAVPGATREPGKGSMSVQGLSQLLPGAAVFQHMQG